MYTRTEQLTQLADIQMAMNPTPTADLEMIHAHLIFGQFETSFYGPTGKRNSEQLFQSNIIRARKHVRDKVFDLLRLQYIAGYNKAMSRTRQRILALLAIKLREFHFPDQRTFFALFNVKLLPSLLLKFAGINKQILHFTGRQRFGRKTWKMPFTASLVPSFRAGMKQNCRFMNPASKVGWYLSHIVLPQVLQTVKEAPVPAIPFVKGPGKYTNTIIKSVRDLAQSNVCFLVVESIFRNARFFTTFQIIRPTLGQIQVAVQKALEIAKGVADMHRNHTVVSFAGITAPLPLDTGSMGAFFGMSRIVHGSDSLGMGVVSSHDRLNAVAESLLVPVDIRKESLQGSGRCFCQKGDGFSTLALQRGYLAPHVAFQMPTGLRAVKAVIELFQKCSQFFANVFDFFRVHANSPPNKVIYGTYRLDMFKFLSPYGAVVLIVQPGSFYLMDRGYVDFARLYTIQQASAFFVTRCKRNFQFQRRYSHPVDKSTGLRCDQTIITTGVNTAKDYPIPLRRIRYYDADTGKNLIFITNNFDLPALIIALLYKARWQVELFFKWIKQHLRIKAFYGTSANAVKTQVWIAVCVYVLVAILKKKLDLDQSLYTILQFSSVSIFEKTPISEAFSQVFNKTKMSDYDNQLLLFNL